MCRLFHPVKFSFCLLETENKVCVVLKPKLPIVFLLYFFLLSPSFFFFQLLVSKFGQYYEAACREIHKALVLNLPDD